MIRVSQPTLETTHSTQGRPCSSAISFPFHHSSRPPKRSPSFIPTPSPEMTPAPTIPMVTTPAHDFMSSSLIVRLTSAWNAATVPPQTSRSVDLFMILFVSVFLFLTATVVRLVPWASPLNPRPSWSSRSRLAHSNESDPLSGYPSYAYGTIAHPADQRLDQRPAAAAPSYETLIEIGDRIGTAKNGLTEDQINILPTYCCPEDNEDSEHIRRGLYCAICRDKYRCQEQVCILPCADEFHTACISPWLRQQATCPLCRCRFA